MIKFNYHMLILPFLLFSTNSMSFLSLKLKIIRKNWDIWTIVKTLTNKTSKVKTNSKSALRGSSNSFKTFLNLMNGQISIN